MKTIVVVIICITVLTLAYIFTRSQPILYGVDEVSWPANWNFDWSGGPGRDRHEIMREAGPYHMDHGAPHSTPGGDGRARR